VLKSAAAVDRFTYHNLPFSPKGEPYRDENDRHLVSTGLNMATQNHQYERVVRQTEVLFQQITGRRLTGPNDPGLAGCQPEVAERYRAFFNYLEVERQLILDQPVSEAEEKEAARQVEEFYAKWWPYGRF
jgi:hypothetical protein